MNYAIPCVSRIVDDNVDLSAAEFSGLRDERLNIGVVEYVARDGDGATAALVDGSRYGLGFL
jgi:hypothetical protein